MTRSNSDQSRGSSYRNRTNRPQILANPIQGKGIDFAHIAPILCAVVTTDTGLKETEARPAQWVAISGIGGLGHVAVQHAKAMGLKVVVLDIAAGKLALARDAGANVAVDARSADAIAQVIDATGGGAHGILVTAVSPPAFSKLFDRSGAPGRKRPCGSRALLHRGNRFVLAKSST